MYKCSPIVPTSEHESQNILAYIIVSFSSIIFYTDYLLFSYIKIILSLYETFKTY